VIYGLFHKPMRYAAWGWWGGRAPEKTLRPKVILNDFWFEKGGVDGRVKHGHDETRSAVKDDGFWHHIKGHCE